MAKRRNRVGPGRRIREWAEGYPPIVAMCGVVLGACAPAITELMSAVHKEPDWWPPLTRGHERKWWAYYRNAELFWLDLLRDIGFLETDPEDDEEVDFDRFVRRMIRVVVRRRATPELIHSFRTASLTAREIRTWSAYWRRLSRVAVQQMVREYSRPLDAPLSDSEATEARELQEMIAGSASMLFLLRVVVPCIAEYGVSPWSVFEEAAEGKRPKVGALEQLLSIDKHAHRHPVVSALIHQKGNQRYFRFAAKALLTRPRKRSLKQWKYRSMRLAKHLFAGLGCEFLEPDARLLLDCFEAMRSGELRDPDVADCSKTFSRALRNETGFWRVLPKPDTNLPIRVRSGSRRAA